MKSKHLYVLLCVLLFSSAPKSQVEINNDYLKSLNYTHDLNLPDWGPYTKNYIGVSHIPVKEEGIRFDLSIFPGFYRRKVTVPNVFHESGFHPWEASPNLEYFSFRHELEWKDKVYSDISYAKIDTASRAFRMVCINNTESYQSIVMHLMASIHFPPLKPYNPNSPIKQCNISLPSNSKWTDALDYKKFEYPRPSYNDHLVYDGKFRGEVREHGLVNGSGIRLGKAPGEYVEYEFEVPKQIPSPVLCVRYKTELKAVLGFSGIVDETVVFYPDNRYKMKFIPFSNIKPGDHKLKIVSKSKGKLILDGFAILSTKDTSLIKIEALEWKYVPEVIDGPTSNSVILKYPNLNSYYGIYWDYPDFQLREWFYKDLSDDFKRMVNSHTESKFSNNTNGHFFNVFLRPINLEPNSTHTINGAVCYGTFKEVSSFLKEISLPQIENAHANARKYLVDYKIIPAGKKYLFSQKRMAANTITNVVYPVYTQNEYIKHHAPGRWWDCLYTWDAGFIGLGLSQLDITRGIESLNTYLNEPDEQSAFIHHGTPIPVQHYLFHEIWNKTQSQEFLTHYYPRLKKYYNFLAGTTPGSTTRNLNSNLIRTWDYFYNSGGWDDYPPQKNVHLKNLTATVTPVVSTAHLIRIAKILKIAAEELILKDDIMFYASHIQMFSEALNTYSWDEKSGYYGYVIHDSLGKPEDILKFNNGVNYNMGLGGASPLISGICNPNQTKMILSHLKTNGKIWSDIGLSAVDQTAPYFSKNGYWNGTVWMPHQWFFWKTMLDIGEADFATQIATTALDLWKKETEASYNCFEHFVIETGRGAGWHQFSGLSCPVLSWFNAYYVQGTITTGFNSWIKKKNFSESDSKLEAQLLIGEKNSENFSVIVCLNPQYSYKAFWQGKKVKHKELHKGSLIVTIPNNLKQGILKIEKM